MINLSNLAGPPVAGFYEKIEKGIGFPGTGSEFWMKLSAHEPGMIRDFYYFH
jgi:hypothetical protein